MDYQATIVVGWIFGAAVAALVFYGLVRLAVSHGIQDAKRRTEEGSK